jgi:hypothetical protein
VEAPIVNGLKRVRVEWKRAESFVPNPPDKYCLARVLNTIPRSFLIVAVLAQFCSLDQLFTNLALINEQHFGSTRQMLK